MANNKKTTPQKKTSTKAAPKTGSTKKPAAKKPAAKKEATKKAAPKVAKPKKDVAEIAELDEVISALDDLFAKKAEEVKVVIAPIAEEAKQVTNETVEHFQAQATKISKWRKLFKFGKK